MKPGATHGALTTGCRSPGGRLRGQPGDEKRGVQEGRLRGQPGDEERGVLECPRVIDGFLSWSP